MSQEKDLHPIFSRDPREWMDCVGQTVCVHGKDGHQYVGVVYTIDPVSESVVLVQETEEGRLHLDVIMGHCVEDLKVTGSASEELKARLDALFKPVADPNLSPETICKRRNDLRSWLLKNRLPVQESPDNPDVLCIADALFIEPPYGADNCRSTNEIVLGRIQGLIKNMPVNQEDWEAP